MDRQRSARQVRVRVIAAMVAVAIHGMLLLWFAAFGYLDRPIPSRPQHSIVGRPTDPLPPAGSRTALNANVTPSAASPIGVTNHPRSSNTSHPVSSSGPAAELLHSSSHDVATGSGEPASSQPSFQPGRLLRYDSDPSPAAPQPTGATSPTDKSADESTAKPTRPSKELRLFPTPEQTVRVR